MDNPPTASQGLQRALQSMNLDSVVSTQRLEDYFDGQDDLFRQRAQRLADDFSSKRTLRRRKIIGDKQRRIKSRERKIQFERKEARVKPFPRGVPKRRCFDWMIREGDVHYARNGSSFESYTKIDHTACHIKGFGEEYRAIGIGTVRITAARAPECASVCEIILHEVLHIPTMPCNGISESKMRDVGLQVKAGRYGPVVLGPDGVDLFCGRMHHLVYKRVSLAGLPVGECPLEEDGTPIPISISSTSPRRVSELGEAARMMKDIRRRLGFNLLDRDCEVEC